MSGARLCSAVLLSLTIHAFCADGGGGGQFPCFINSLGLEMVLVPENAFVMGHGYTDGLFDNRPHQVRLSPYYIASTELTKGQYRRFVMATGQHGELPELNAEADPNNDASPWRRAPGDEYPIHTVDWSTAKAVAAWLASVEGLPYRLPTEAEWECAAQAGRGSPPIPPNAGCWRWCRSEGQLDLAREVRYFLVCGDLGPGWQAYRFLAPWGVHPCNAFGLWDMFGNALEWCEDWYAPTFPDTAEIRDPKGPESGQRRVLRGGDYVAPAMFCGAHFRWNDQPSAGVGGIRLVIPAAEGFRLPASCRVPGPPPAVPTTPLAARLDTFTLKLSKTVTIEFLKVPAGRFMMGSPDDEPGRGQYEGPCTSVTIERPFWLAKYELTRRQWYLLERGTYDKMVSADCDNDRPVDLAANVYSFLSSLSENVNDRERAAGRLPAGAEYRLPTTWEWEYACRAGTTTRYSFGDDPQFLPHYAWQGFLGRTQDVGKKLPNPWGFYDMHGNVWEAVMPPFVCYPGGELPAGGFARRITEDWLECRGGSFDYGPIACRSAMRLILDRGIGCPYVGIRLVRTIPEGSTTPPSQTVDQ